MADRRLLISQDHLNLSDPPELDLSTESLDQIARVARAIAQLDARKHGVLLDERNARPYEHCTPQERAGMRAGALRCMQALLILGYIER